MTNRGDWSGTRPSEVRIVRGWDGREWRDVVCFRIPHVAPSYCGKAGIVIEGLYGFECRFGQNLFGDGSDLSWQDQADLHATTYRDALPADTTAAAAFISGYVE